MLITASIYTIQQLNMLKNNIEAALIYVPKQALVYNPRLDVLKAVAICKDNNILPILGMNKLLTPKDVEAFKNALIKYQDLECYFYFADLGAVQMAFDFGLNKKVIYDPETMITNYLDAKEYYNLGIDSVGISSEIPLADVTTILDKTNIKAFYQVFGYRKMMISKRHLLSLYASYSRIKLKKETHFYLKESTREDYCPFIENQNGVVLYRSYILSLLDNLEQLKNLQYCYIETLFLDKLKVKDIVELFSLTSKGKITIAEAKRRIATLALEIKDGFKYQDSVYQKECF